MLLSQQDTILVVISLNDMPSQTKSRLEKAYLEAIQQILLEFKLVYNLGQELSATQKQKLIKQINSILDNSQFSVD